MLSKKIGLATLALMLGGWVGATRAGSILNLTTPGASGSLDGGYFFQTNPAATGTGNFDAFLEIGQSGASNHPVERAYNSDRSTQLFEDGSSAQHNHSVLLSTIPFVTFTSSIVLGDGSILKAGQYYEFILDVNQQDSKGGTLLSLSELQVFASSVATLAGYDLSTHQFGANVNSIYDLGGRVIGDQVGDGSGATRDTTRDLINVDYGTNGGGSGHGDLAFYLPTSFFNQFNPSTTFITLSNVIGVPNFNDDGFEEWGFIRARVGTPDVIAEPASIVIAGSSLLILGAYAWRRRQVRAHV
jgi:hypothetical protein